MRNVSRPWLWIFLIMLLSTGYAWSKDTLNWRSRQNQVDAQIQNWNLPTLLTKIKMATGWEIHVEPGTTNDVSTKFKSLPEDQALRRLLGSLNYFKDQTNGITRLFVFRTVSAAATQLVKVQPKDYRIKNELLVKMKNGATNSIEQLAKKAGAKIIGRDDKLGFYRLQFADGSSADAGLQTLLSDPSVAASDYNYTVDRPTPVQMTPAGPAVPSFTLNPPSENGVIVGLVDTEVYPPAQFQKYMLTPINIDGTTAPSTDEPSHGTSMLETLVSSMAANPSMILPVNVYGSGEDTTIFNVVPGLVAAINAGANPINMSFGGTGDSTILQSVIDEGIAKGIQFVAASGNTPGTELTYPAAYNGVLAVTASDPTTGQLASYADDGSFVKAMASGTEIVLAADGQPWTIEGTSPATATMTGTIAELENQNHISVQAAAALAVQTHPPPLNR